MNMINNHNDVIIEFRTFRTEPTLNYPRPHRVADCDLVVEGYRLPLVDFFLDDPYLVSLQELPVRALLSLRLASLACWVVVFPSYQSMPVQIVSLVFSGCSHYQNQNWATD